MLTPKPICFTLLLGFAHYEERAEHGACSGRGIAPLFQSGFHWRRMYLTRCHDQKSKTLDEFFEDVRQQDHVLSREGGKAMLGLMGRLRALPDSRQMYGLTSHHRLCPLAADSYQSPWFVIISALDNRNYFVEYRMPDDVAPWPHAYVRGKARSEDDAVQMIVTAMEKSEGWSERR
jgi:hypothetical protein